MGLNTSYMRKLTERGKPYTRQALFTNEPMSPEVPNWEAYRLQLDRMKGLRSESTHWRITCNFDPASVVGYRDYVRAKFKNFNLLTYSSDKTCELLEYMNFYGIRSFRLRVVSPTVCSPTVRVDSPTSYMSVRLRVRC